MILPDAAACGRGPHRAADFEGRGNEQAIGRTTLMVLPPEPGRKNGHLVMILHKGGGWYEAQCTSAAKRCRAGTCEHSRGLKWSDASRPIKQAPFVAAHDCPEAAR